MHKIAPQKILHLAKYYAPHGGGVETHLQEINRILLKRSYQVAVITLQHDEKLPLQENIEGVKVMRIPYSLGMGELLFKLELWSFIAKNSCLLIGADIIQIHDVFWWIWPLYPLVSHKIFTTFHGYEGSHAPSRKQRWWHQLAARLSRGNLCIGGFHRKWYRVKPTLVSFGATRKLKKVSTFSEIGESGGVGKSSATKKSNFFPNQLTTRQIIFVGRLAQDNGILDYLRGFKLLLSQDQEWHLDIYGDGPLKDECRQLIEKHNLPAKLHGFVEKAGLKISQYDVAFVSRYLAILEALVSGVKVIAHYNNQIKFDYLKLSPFSSWIEIVQTPEKIHEAILSKDQLPKIASRWASIQTWEKMIKKYEKIWQ